MKNKNIIFYLLAVVSLNIFAIVSPFGIGPSFFYMILAFCVFGLFNNGKHKAFSLLLAIFASFMAVVPSVTANHFLRYFDRWIYFGTLYLIILINGFDYFKDNLFWWVMSGIKALPTFFLLKRKSAIVPKMNEDHPEKNQNKIQIILLTFLMTLIVLVLFGSLLASADPVFSKMIEELFDSFLERFIFSAILLGFMLLANTFCYRPSGSDYLAKKIPTISALIASSSLVALFGLFIFVQVKYLFASEATFKALDITYSDYVRAGFTQLLWVGALGFILIYFLHLRTKIIEKVAQIIWVKSINIILIVELFLILLSAAKRNWMYVSAYGLTRIRWVGGVFLVWLALVFCIKALLVTVEKIKDKQFIYGFFVLGIIAISFLNLVNMDQVIANYRPEDDFKKIDYYYLSLLSEDIVDSWFKVVPQMEIDIDHLTSKNKLVDDEKKQLASIKLALFNMDYKINMLKIKYADDELVMRNAVCSIYRYDNPPYYDYYLDIWTFNDDKCENWVKNNEVQDSDQKLWQEEYDKLRKIQSLNLSEYQAYLLLHDKTEIDTFIFSKLFKKITDYQTTYHLSLWDEINWRQHYFEAPLVNAQIDYELLHEDYFRKDERSRGTPIEEINVTQEENLEINEVVYDDGSE